MWVARILLLTACATLLPAQDPLIVIAIREGRLADAIQQLTKPDASDREKILLGNAQYRAGRHSDAVRTLSPLLASYPKEPEVAIPWAASILQNPAAKPSAPQAANALANLGMSQRRGMFLYSLGLEMFFRQDMPAAVKQLTAAAGEDPALPYIHSFLGRALLFSGDPDAALPAFAKQLERDSDFDAALYSAQILTRRKQAEAAQRFIELAARMRPDSPELSVVNGKPQLAATLGAPPSAPGPAVGSRAPEFTLPQASNNQPISLSAFRNKRPLLLLFGSYTCPNFRRSAEAINAAHAKLGDRIPFLLVYIKEAHAQGQWQAGANEREGVDWQPARTQPEMREHATTCQRRLKMNFPALVDDPKGTVADLYSAWPSRLYLLDNSGRITYSTGLTELEFDVALFQSQLQKLLP